jgi:hypothetical protein
MSPQGQASLFFKTDILGEMVDQVRGYQRIQPFEDYEFDPVSISFEIHLAV